MTVIEGKILPNDYLLRKLKASLASRERELQALKSRLEETTRAAAVREANLLGKINTLTRSLKNYKSWAARPREIKPKVETKAEAQAEAQGVRESVEEDYPPPVSPPIST